MPLRSGSNAKATRQTPSSASKLFHVGVLRPVQGIRARAFQLWAERRQQRRMSKQLILYGLRQFGKLAVERLMNVHFTFYALIWL